MATCTLAIATADTGASPNTSGAFTPSIGDLLVVLVQAASTNDAAPTCTSSIGGFTLSLITTRIYATSHEVVAFVSDALVSSASSQTVTVDFPNDGCQGTVIEVYRISGITKLGLLAILQSAANNTGAASTPDVTFSIAVTTSNPTLAILGNSTNPAGITPPTGWTEPATSDTGYDTPTQGAACCHRDSGFASTTIQWAANSPTAWGIIAIEVDASSASSAPAGRMLLTGIG